MKSVIITKNDLKDIIYEVIYKCYSKLPLNEYFIRRSKFVDNVWHLSYQIVENWCLVHYCTLIGRTDMKEHWADELYAHLNNIARDGIKNNNSVKTRERAIIEGFEYASLYDGRERILQIIKGKLKKENIKTDEVIIKVAEDFSNSINDIVSAMAEFYENDRIDEYIHSI